MNRRVCPLCTVRTAGVVDPDCTVCGGHGYLVLGARGAAHFDPHVLSTAVHLALEASARHLEETTTRAQDPRPAIRDTLAKLAKAGIIDPKPPAPPATGPTGRHPGPAAMIAAKSTGCTPTRTDQLMIRAHPYPYADHDRPGARGTPVFSHGWHPSSLACVLDPFDFDTTVLHQAMERRARTFRARVLTEIALHPPKIRRKKR